MTKQYKPKLDNKVWTRSLILHCFPTILLISYLNANLCTSHSTIHIDICVQTFEFFAVGEKYQRISLSQYKCTVAEH